MKQLNKEGTYTERLLCVKSSTNLTVGCWYDLLDEDDRCYCIWDDVTIYSYSKNYFKTDQQIRKDKLEKINDARKKKRTNI